MSSRTFKVTKPHMKGDDILRWQRNIDSVFSSLGVDCPIVFDGVYGVSTRAYTATLCYALGIHPEKAMASGVTPQLRSKIRNRELTQTEEAKFESRVEWRRRLRARWAPLSEQVHAPVSKIIADSWGFHPGVHDGIDVITLPSAPLFAMVRSRVIDVRAGGWWGKAPSGDVSKGDGIVQLEILKTVGPFKEGYHIGYGHAENARVKVGDIVNPGDWIANAGLAVAYHIHLMYNTGVTTKGVGNIDPREILDYAVRNG